MNENGHKTGLITSQDRTGFHRADESAPVYVQKPGLKNPLEYMLRKLGVRKVRAATYKMDRENWFDRGGAATGVYTNDTLATPYVSGGTKDSAPFHIKLPDDAMSNYLQKNDTIRVVDEDTGAQVRGRVIGVRVAGTNSRVSFKLMETDSDAVLASTNLIVVKGSFAAPIVTTLPPGRYHELSRNENYAQKFIQGVQISEEEKKTFETVKDERGNIVKRALARALRDIRCDVEDMIRWGIKDTDGGGADLTRFSGGIEYWIDEEGLRATNIIDCSATDAYFPVGAWEVGTLRGLQAIQEYNSRYNQDDVITVIAGGEALSAINVCVQLNGEFGWKETTNVYGMNCQRLVGLGKPMEFIHDTTFSTSPASRDRKAMMLLDMQALRLAEFDALKKLGKEDIDPEDVKGLIDVIQMGWKHECGLHVDDAKPQMILYNVGVDNAGAA